MLVSMKCGNFRIGDTHNLTALGICKFIEVSFFSLTLSEIHQIQEAFESFKYTGDRSHNHPDLFPLLGLKSINNFQRVKSGDIFVENVVIDLNDSLKSSIIEIFPDFDKRKSTNSVGLTISVGIRNEIYSGQFDRLGKNDRTQFICFTAAHQICQKIGFLMKIQKLISKLCSK